MEPQRFDRLAKTLSATGSRRGLLRVLAALPITGGLLTLREPESLAGKRRKNVSGTYRISITNCDSQSRAKTCKDRCGPVEDNCAKTVNCGPCGTCRTDTEDCDCPSGVVERECVTNPRPGERVPSCVCDRDFCRFDGPLSLKPTRCCSCGTP